MAVVKVYRSDQMDAPTINGLAGSLIDALDAILVNGYGQVDVSSITRVANTATVETVSPHGLETGDWCLIGGANEIEYNGEHLVTVTGATTYTIAVADEPSTPATGSITSKRAPAGFAKPFADTNIGVYRSNDMGSRRHFFQVIDTAYTTGGGREATIRGFESMSDAVTGSGVYPDASYLTNGFFWVKSSDADNAAKGWVLVTDGKTVYHFAYHNNAYDEIGAPSNNSSSVAFGDIVSYRAGDIYASFVTGQSRGNTFTSTQYIGLFYQRNDTSNGGIGSLNPTSDVTAVLVLARDFTGVAAPKYAQVNATGYATELGYRVYTPYPHMPDNGFYMVPCLVGQGAPPSSTPMIRGRMPGMFEPLHGRALPNMAVIDNVRGYVGRKFMMLYGKTLNTQCSCVLDITGPWDS